jgi:putative NADPH-quinone reductase
MAKRILIIDGHPDERSERFVHALSKAYYDGACSAGHEIHSIIVSEMDFPILRRTEEFRSEAPSDSIRQAQELIAKADHLVILYPLWLGSMPALLKAFFEQVLRPGFAFAEGERDGLPRGLLSGKSARIVVTMGMPAFVYRLYFRAHSLKSFERNILAFCGVGPIRASVIGGVEAADSRKRGTWLARMQALGARAK